MTKTNRPCRSFPRPEPTPRSFCVTGVPKISAIAFAALARTAWSTATRISIAASTSSAFASEGTRSSGSLSRVEVGHHARVRNSASLAISTWVLQ